jgi:acetyl esterase/lipase
MGKAWWCGWLLLTVGCGAEEPAVATTEVTVPASPPVEASGSVKNARDANRGGGRNRGARSGGGGGAPGADSNTCVTEIGLTYANGNQLDVYRAKGGTGAAVISVHGGGWTSGTRLHDAGLAGALCEEGFTVFAIDYRLAPANPYPAAVDDVKAALAWVGQHADEYGVDPNRVGLMGASAGAHLAALGAMDGTNAAALVMFSGPTDLTNPTYKKDREGIWTFLNGADPAAASPVRFASKDDPPTIIVQGTADGLVDPADAGALGRALDAVGVKNEVVMLSGAPHMPQNKEPWASELMPKVVAFLHANLDRG